LIFILLFLIPALVFADEALVLEKISNLASSQANTQGLINDFIKTQKSIDDKQDLCITNNEKALISISKDTGIMSWVAKIVFGILIGTEGTVIIGRIKNGKA